MVIMELTAKQTIKGWLNSNAFLTYAEPLVGEGTKKGASVKQWENGKSWAAHFSCKES